VGVDVGDDTRVEVSSSLPSSCTLVSSISMSSLLSPFVVDDEVEVAAFCFAFCRFCLLRAAFLLLLVRLDAADAEVAGNGDGNDDGGGSVDALTLLSSAGPSPKQPISQQVHPLRDWPNGDEKTVVPVNKFSKVSACGSIVNNRGNDVEGVDEVKRK
jgi:hypothetical protein